MKALKIIQLLLLPLSWLYQLILRGRNWLYDTNLLAASTFDIPVIALGNLAFGGTGKTPHTEYLIELLSKNNRVGVLSRGYGRRSSGYFFVNQNPNALLVGDEPLQIHLNYPQAAVGVCENRVLGIPHLLYDAPETNLVLLDDAFQHRPLKAGRYILLTDFNRLYSNDFLFPAGYLREYRAAVKRAHAIIVTKCPADLSISDANEIKEKLGLKPQQKLFFSTLTYGQPLHIIENTPAAEEFEGVVAFAGIANPIPFEKEIRARYKEVGKRWFADHHVIKENEFKDLSERLALLKAEKKAFITTAKDRSKLLSQPLPAYFEALPIYYLPIKVKLLFNEEEELLEWLNEYILTYRD